MLEKRRRDVLGNLSDVRTWLAGRKVLVLWAGQTHLLCRGIEAYAGEIAVIPTTPAGEAMCRTCEIPWASLAQAVDRYGARDALVLSFRPTPDLLDAVTGTRWRVASPDLQIVDRVGDKTELPAILEMAAVPLLRQRIVEGGCTLDARSLWREFNHDRLVVQEPEDNRTGGGTHLVCSEEELGAILSSGGRRKVVEYLEGRGVTISGCVAHGIPYASGVSRQLVGLEPLVDRWSAHCGNDVVLPGFVSAGELRQMGDVCRSIGRVLFQHYGFQGHYGLDMILSNTGTPYTVEINARMQSVTTLVNAAEVELGRVPLHALHMAAFFSDADRVVPPSDLLEPFPCHHSQLVIYHCGEPRRITGDLCPGIHRLRHGKLEHARSRGDLTSVLSDEEVLITPFQLRGQLLTRGDRLAVVQRRGEFTSDDGKLTARGEAVVRSIREILLAPESSRATAGRHDEMIHE